jgi:hypothetical protein
MKRRDAAIPDWRLKTLNKAHKSELGTPLKHRGTEGTQECIAAGGP